MTEEDYKERALHKKLIKAKRMFLESGIKKKGYNKYFKYDYYRLEDIEPVAVDIMDELEVDLDFNMTREEVVLHVIDTESGGKNEYTFPLPPINSVGAKAVQEYGACQTYAMRYLYIQAFHIVETEVIDRTEGIEEASGKEEDEEEKVKQKALPLPENKNKIERSGKFLHQNLRAELYQWKKNHCKTANVPSEKELLFHAKRNTEPDMLEEDDFHYPLTCKEYDKLAEYIHSA